MRINKDLTHHVDHIVQELSGGIDHSEWAYEWHEENCNRWAPTEHLFRPSNEYPMECVECGLLEGDHDDETMGEHLEWCDERPTVFDWLEGALDIEYTIDSDGQFLGGRVLVAFGGPNIWVDTRYERVEGYWWGDEWTESFTDNLGLHEALEELWEMNAKYK